MAQHFTEIGTMGEDEDGFVEPVCACGKRLGSFVDVEDAADALMGHAYEQGWLDATKENA